MTAKAKHELQFGQVAIARPNLLSPRVRYQKLEGHQCLSQSGGESGA
jgi:hypothetical protein